MLNYIRSLQRAGVQYVGTYNLEYLASTKKENEKHATLEHPDGRTEIIAIKKNWLY